MDNNKFLGESGLNQLITNVHDVTFKEISYDDYMALPEEERKTGRYAVVDWPEDSNIKIGNIAYDITTLWEGDIGYNGDKQEIHQSFELNDSIKNYDVIAIYTGQYTSTSEKTNRTFTKWTYYITSELRIEPDIISVYSIDNTGGSQFRRIAFTFIDEKTIDLNYIQRMSIYKVIGLKFKMITGSGESSKHSYSTEEQVVGTWIDGKSVYESSKIIDCKTANVIEPDGRRLRWTESNSPFFGLNIENIISFSSSIMYNNICTALPTFPILNVNNPIVDYLSTVIFCNPNNLNMQLLLGTYYNIDDYYNNAKILYNIRYTKTTD